MKVFVLGTGRCGTVTFSKAAGYATNYATRHEPPIVHPTDLDFADRTITVSPHLSWLLAPLAARHEPPLLYVHLRRKREQVVGSWVRRGQSIGPGRWTPLALRLDGRRIPTEHYRAVCGLCYDAIVGQIDAFLDQQMRYCGTKVMRVWLHEAESWWPMFWDAIGAEGNYEGSLGEWSVKHNEGRK